MRKGYLRQINNIQIFYNGKTGLYEARIKGIGFMEDFKKLQDALTWAEGTLDYVTRPKIALYPSIRYPKKASLFERLRQYFKRGN